MLCFRCGSHVQDGAEKCWNCGTVLSSAQKRRGASTAELRARQRTGSRVFGVVFKIGDLIANRYRVKDIVGSGGAGVVYRAHDQEIDVDVAVKVINAKLVQTSDEQRLFSRQTKIARKLSHQNVVRIYDEGRDDARPYVTMQFLEGLSLRRIIDLRKEKKQTFALAEVEPIFNQLCQALDYAHKTTFHGDLKPDNVIVLPDLLKITDFELLRGLPRKPFLAIQKSRGTNFGYLAPEVRLEVADLDRTIDVYSLGVVLGEMLTGVVYDDTKPEQISVSATGLDPAIHAVIKRCVARAPKDRYASTVDLYADLRSALTKGVSKAKSNADAAADAPTQRLEMDKHGSRPISEDIAKRPESDDRPQADERPKPVEIQPNLAVASAVERPASPHEQREGTDAHDLIDIEDDMIESSIVAKKGQPSAPPANGVPTNGVNGKSGKATPAPLPPKDEAESVEPDLVDNPNAVELPDDEEETIAVFDHPPIPSRPVTASGEPVRLEPGLEEISNSAIELIADPRATNVYDLDERGDPKPSIRVHDVPSGLEVPTKNRTLQPTPLPDSALPEPAFSQVARDDTRHGRLDGQDEDAPEGEATRGIAYSPKPQTRGPTAAMGSTDAPKAKKRPMTRPRMPTMQPAPVPMTSTLGGAAVMDPSNMPRPPTQEALSIPSMVAAQSPSPPAPPSEPPRQRGVMITMALSIFAVLLALVIVVIVLTRQADLQSQIQAMQQEASQARANGKVAEADAKRAGEAALAAGRAEEEAQKRAEAADAQQKAAELAAKEKEAEARRLQEEAKKSENAETALAAKKRAEAASAEAAERRAAAAEAAAERREEKRRAAEERKKREAREQEQKEKARLAKEESEAARRAEDRAARLAREEAADESRSAKAQAAAEEERRRKEAAEAAKAREEERKRREAEERAKAEAKKEEPTPAAIAPATDTPECPKGMVLVKGGGFMLGSKRNDPERNFGDKDYVSVEVPSFCVDYYEYPNGRGRTPSTKVSFKTAEARCKKRKKRLCSEEEWEKACKGPSGSRYPYANQWNPSSCNTEDDEGADREVEKSGSFRKCRSGYNVFDLSGNVAEWTSSKWGSAYVVKGGASDRPGYDGRCAARKKKKAGTSSETLGFRCCADPG